MKADNSLMSYIFSSVLITDPPTLPLCCIQTFTLPFGSQRTDLLMNEANKEAWWRRRWASFSWHFRVGWRSTPSSALYINYQALSGRHFVRKTDERAVRRGTNLTWPGWEEGPLILVGCNGGRCANVCVCVCVCWTKGRIVKTCKDQHENELSSSMLDIYLNNNDNTRSMYIETVFVYWSWNDPILMGFQYKWWGTKSIVLI